MSSRLEKLLFSVSLIDKVSGPAGKIAAQIDQLNRRATQGFAQVGVGAAGLFSTGYALSSILSPAIEMDRALGEVKSLGVADSALKQLEKTALSFSTRYGESATDFVRSSYDIQSAIAGLTGNELSKFTQASGVLAKATKSDTGTITDYMGTMYGIFQNTANQMGKAEWVQMLAGQTASAVQMFKTTGSEMAASFANLGAEAQSHGVAMNEQMAILGTLQATMSGSEAGTKYKSFLAGVGKAQAELGLRFTDSQGKLLPMVDILQKIQSKYGEIDTVAESDALRKAFGTKEAVGLIKLLSQNVEGLAGNISALGSLNGMDKAMEMADAMVDPWERLGAVGEAVKTVFGRVMQPVLVPLANSLISGGEAIVRWTELFPNLTRVIGIGTLVVFGLVAAVSAFSLATGVAGMAMAGWHSILLVGRTALLLFNAALWANPITWVVGGVLLLGAALAGLVIYWDKVQAALAKSVVFQLLRLAVQGLTASLSFLWDGLGMIIDGWKLLFDLFGVTTVFNNVLTLFQAIGTVIGAVASAIGWLIQKVWQATNLFAGFLKTVADNGLIQSIAGLFGGDNSLNLNQKVEQERDAMNQVAGRISGDRLNAVPTGGLMQQISNATHNKGTTVEKMEIHTNQPVNGFLLADELALA